ncbi:hypothetical protein CE91St50_15810 [Clostridioides difficile]|nr:hypothetical protein CE91St50_15810 [Clostridioides difficile]
MRLLAFNTFIVSLFEVSLEELPANIGFISTSETNKHIETIAILNIDFYLYINYYSIYKSFITLYGITNSTAPI